MKTKAELEAERARVVASLFPGKGGAAKVAHAAATASNAKQLRDQGWLPVKWKGAIRRLQELGIEVQKREDARVAATKDIPGTASEGQAAGTPIVMHWAPRWAVLVYEAEPCNETARDWALERAAKDEEFRQALETIATLSENQGTRERMANYIMELWEPPGDE